MAKLVTANLEIDKVIGDRLRRERLANGLSQEQVAEKLGISFQQVQKYEKGTNRVAVSTLFRMASIFGAHPAVFFKHVGDELGRAA